jgi:hypothetical protein
MKKIIALTTAIGVALVVLTGVAPASAEPTTVDTTIPTVEPLADPAQTLWPLYQTVYDGAIYELVTEAGVETPVPLLFEKWRDVYKFSSFENSPTDFVKYPWSPTVYAVTLWPGGEGAWQWTPITFAQWQTAGFPSARTAGWIEGSYYYQWGSSPEVFVEGADGINHKLSYSEWEASGFRPFQWRSAEGFFKLTWSEDIVRMTNIGFGQGGPIDYAEWAAEGFPTPQVGPRLPNDMFLIFPESSTVYYTAAGIYRPVTFEEWTAAGRPTPELVKGH